jgi:tellurite resistance protein TerB
MLNRFDNEGGPMTRHLTAVAEMADDLAHCNEVLVQALAAAGALVALCDGRVETIERDECVNFVDSQRIVPTMSRQDIGQIFDKYVRQLKRQGDVATMVDTFHPLAGQSSASLVLRVAERVAAADRGIHPAEVQALSLISLIMMTLPAERDSAARRRR